MNTKRKVPISRKRFKNASAARHIDMKEVSKITHIPYETLRNCLGAGEIMPDNLESICKVLNVSKDYLQGKKRKKSDLPQFTIVKAKDKDALQQLQYILPGVDSEGYEIPTYDDDDKKKKLTDVREALFAFISLAISCPTWNKTFFDENYDEIIDFFAPSIYGLSNYIQKKTGRFAIMHPLTERKREEEDETNA